MRFCVRCGTDVENPVDGLCVECYLDGREFTSLPDHVDLEVCAVCKEFYVGGRWVPDEKRRTIEDAAVDQMYVLNDCRVLSIATQSKPQDEKTHKVHVRTELSVRGTPVISECDTVVRIKNTVCKRCSRVQGSYYESILQIRSEERTLDDDVLKNVKRRVNKYIDFHAKSNRQCFISKTVDIHGGVDFYISTLALGKILAKMISDQYCGDTKESFKLVGRKPDGQNMYRVTYLVRLPKFKEGDVVEYKNGYYRLKRILPGGGRLISLKSFRDKYVPRPDMPQLKVYRTEDELMDATVISGDPPEVQVLNPLNYETLDMRVPKDVEVGSQIKVVDIDGILHYVP
ncbi:MAG: 60S ribosomal export protein NMD3 [Candidatus Methanomethylophilaceae archaeon]